MNYRVPFIKPSFPTAEQISSDYKNIVARNWFTNFGPYEQQFRREAAEFLGEGAVTCTVANATLGLEIATRVLFEKNKDSASRVLVPAFTFAAGPEVLVSAGYTPVFIDIDKTLQPDIRQAEEYIKNNRSSISGVMLCNIFGTGNLAIEDWEELAIRHGLPLVIDSAAGFGSEYADGERVGLRGDCEIFSFHATKPFAVGEGGLIASKSERTIERCKELSNFGFSSTRDIESIGTNAKMQEFNSAIGIRQLGGFAARVAQRRESLQLYKDRLGEKGYTFQDNDELSTVAFVSAVAQTTEASEAAIRRLHEQSVEARRYYTPLHLQKNLARYCEVAGSLEATESVASRIISLPMHDSMSPDDIDVITKAV